MKNPLVEQSEYILRKGRMHLVMEHPFWGELALRLTLVPSPWLPTTAVDAYGRFFYNPTWVAENFSETNKPMSTDDAMFEFAHEIGHLMFRHHARRPAGAIPSVWNLACDQIIDTHMMDAGLKPSVVSRQMVTEAIAKECRQQDGKIKTSEERYYELEKKLKDCPACRKLLDQFKKQVQKQQNGGNSKPPEPQQGAQQPQDGDQQGQESGQGQPGPAQDGHSHGPHGQECDHDGEGDSGGAGGQGGKQGQGEQAEEWNGVGHICKNIRMCCVGSMSEADTQTVEEWKQHIAAAAKVAKSKGNCPALAQDYLAQLERPSRNWKDIIRTQASEVYRNRYSQKRSARRSHAIGIKLPGRTPRPQPPVVAMDCSGSISALAGRFASEIVGILHSAGAPEVRIMFHDTVVYHMDYYDKNDLHKLKVSHGGTSHQDVFAKLKDLNPRPGMLVCFTDMYSDIDMIENPGIPVIWAHPEGIGEEVQVPFGKKVAVTNDGGE